MELSSKQTIGINPQEMEGALIKHYTMKYPAICDSLPLLSNCYKATFVEQPPCEDL